MRCRPCRNRNSSPLRLLSQTVLSWTTCDPYLIGIPFKLSHPAEQAVGQITIPAPERQLAKGPIGYLPKETCMGQPHCPSQLFSRLPVGCSFERFRWLLWSVFRLQPVSPTRPGWSSPRSQFPPRPTCSGRRPELSSKEGLRNCLSRTGDPELVIDLHSRGTHMRLPA